MSYFKLTLNTHDSSHYHSFDILTHISISYKLYYYTFIITIHNSLHSPLISLHDQLPRTYHAHKHIYDRIFMHMHEHNDQLTYVLYSPLNDIPYSNRSMLSIITHLLLSLN